MSFWMFRFASSFLGALPEWAMRRLGEAVGSLAWLWADKRKHNAVRAMARTRGEDPDHPSLDAVAAARTMFTSYGRYWAEALWIRPRRVKAIHRRLEVVGIEHMYEALAVGKGSIYALPHVGNWEVAGLVPTQEDVELLAVAEDLDDKRMVDWFVGLRNSLGIDIVLANAASEVFDTCSDVLGRNGAVALLADRNLSSRGVRGEFFGEETRLPSGPARLAIEQGSPILVVGCFFKPGRGHKLVVGAPIERQPDDTVESLTMRVTAALEDIIRLDPAQWHMVQPNWPSDRRPR